MFFSVKMPLKIGDKTYTPCVCYSVTKELEATISKLNASGKVYTYTEKVGFMNGKALFKKKKSIKKCTKKKTEATEEVVNVNETYEIAEEGF